RKAGPLRERLSGLTPPARPAAVPDGPGPGEASRHGAEAHQDDSATARRPRRGGLFRRTVKAKAIEPRTVKAQTAKTQTVKAKAAKTQAADVAPPAAVSGLAVRRGRVEALSGVGLTVRSGEAVALMGRNGAGKSTLLRTLVGMHEPASGTVRVGGLVPHRTGPRDLLRHVGLVPQEPRDLLYANTVRAECEAADLDAGAAPGACRALVAELLPDVADATHPRDLSEGQRLALALAIVLTARPPLILLDEPTRGLDYAAKARLVEILRALAADGHAIVLATHDVELAAELAHRVVILADGEIVADGPTAEVVVSSPAFAPQVSKVLAPLPWLTVPQVRAVLEPTA
ncbi:hypothetical protein ADK38_36495, partial [Streptomyces varsoviensis]